MRLWFIAIRILSTYFKSDRFYISANLDQDQSKEAIIKERLSFTVLGRLLKGDFSNVFVSRVLASIC